MFDLHQLKVYEKALALCASAETLRATWGRRHAICDHFRRASESIVLNLAEGARLRSGADRARVLDYAIGSSLECAGCLDIAHIKGCLLLGCSVAEKQRYLEVTRMLVGLRKKWLNDALHEESNPYEAESSSSCPQYCFHHESLDMYQVALNFMRWFACLPGSSELSNRLCREVDKAGTSVVLNVAEGNGRYSELDHRRFLEIAGASAARAIVYLELYQQQVLQGHTEINEGRELLTRVLVMLSKF